MFAFLATLGPIGIGAAIVGTIATAAYAYAYMNDDDEKSESSSQDTTHHEEKNKIIKNEIENYKKTQEKRLKEKYGINVKFDSDLFHGLFNHLSNSSFTESWYSNLNSSSKVIQLTDEIDKKFEYISKLENEIQELDNLIFELKRMKNESIC